MLKAEDRVGKDQRGHKVNTIILTANNSDKRAAETLPPHPHPKISS